MGTCMMTSAQMRAARAMLGIDQRALAEQSGVSLPTIQRMEASDGNVRGLVESLTRVVEALNRSGIELIGDDMPSLTGGPWRPLQASRRDARSDEGRMSTSVARPSFSELYMPKLVTVLREGYDLAGLRADALAGLTVAIVALPLSMAIAIASGVAPERGLYNGDLRRLRRFAARRQPLPDRRPAGAFIVLVAATVARYGADGLATAALLSGLMLMAVGWLRLGTFVKFIPYPVTVGFTAGIGVIIFASQIRDLLGLTLAGKEPGDLVPKLEALGGALPTVNGAAVGVALAAIAIIVACRMGRPQLAEFPHRRHALLAGRDACCTLPVRDDRHEIRRPFPRALPMPHLPDLSPARIVQLLPAALSFTLLGAIESLLSAVVADSMSGARHRSNCELVAQGARQYHQRAVRRHLRHRHDRAHRDQCPRRRARAHLGHTPRAVSCSSSSSSRRRSRATSRLQRSPACSPRSAGT